MVVSELRGEKIDIIPYNDEPARFVAKALSPARVREVLVDDTNKQATVIVPDDQLSLAIGREGQNARLAARLTGWRVDIRSETEFAKEEQDTGYGEEEETGGRCAAILGNGRRCPNAALPRSRYCGLDAHQALANKDTDRVGADKAGSPPPHPIRLGAPLRRASAADGSRRRARLVRFANVDGCAVPDPRASLPGRGAWLHPDLRMFRGCDGSSRLQPRLQGARIPLTGHRRLNQNMAKKRVHELAKQYDMPTSEVIKRLNAAGLEVKAAATAVDEKLADAALTGKPKPKAIAGNGAAKKPAAPVLQQRAGFGHGTARAPRAENLAPKTRPSPRPKPKPKPEAGNGANGGRPDRAGPRAPRCRASALPVRPVASAASSSTRRPRAGRVPVAGPAAVPVAAPVAVPRIARRGVAAAGAGAAPTRSPSRRTSRALKADVIRVELRLDRQGRRGVPRRRPCRRSSRS